MAYNYFPKSSASIKAELQGTNSNFSDDKIDEIAKALEFLQGTYKHKSPINIDKQGGKINVTRELQGSFNIDDLPRRAGVKLIKFKWGNGSSGNRGANNRGNKFEKDFSAAFVSWWQGETRNGNPHPEMIPTIQKLNDLHGPFQLEAGGRPPIKDMGAANTRRPLRPTAGGWEVTNPGSGYDIGKAVGDASIKTKRGYVYLSMKLGGTTTFFNVGVKKYLPTVEIKMGQVKNKEGQNLLDLFGINNRDFCAVFNGTLKRSYKATPNVNMSKLQKLIQSGIGYGYDVLHKKPSGIHHYQVDQAYMRNAAKVGRPTVYYGGKGGRGKRIDIEMKSRIYEFKLNIRDSQGGDGYPTRIMCDFKKLN